MWSHVLLTINFTNKSLQPKDISYDVAAKLVEGLCKRIQSLWDQDIGHFVYKAEVLCGDIGVECSLSSKSASKGKTWRQNSSISADIFWTSKIRRHLISAQEI